MGIDGKGGSQVALVGTHNICVSNQVLEHRLQMHMNPVPQ